MANRLNLPPLAVQLMALAFFCQLPTAPLSGQILMALLFGDKLNSEKLDFGLTVGGNFSTLSGDLDASFSRGLNLGLYFNLKLGERWYLHPAAIPKSTLGARGIAPYDLGDATLDSLFSDGTIERRINYVNVPVLIRYQLPAGLGFETGPQPSLRLSATDLFRKDRTDEEELELKRNLRKATNPLEFGWVWGTYYRLGKTQKGLTINLRYVLGLTRVFKGGDERFPPQKNQLIQLLVGIPIGNAGGAVPPDPGASKDE